MGQKRNKVRREQEMDRRVAGSKEKSNQIQGKPGETDENRKVIQ